MLLIQMRGRRRWLDAPTEVSSTSPSLLCPVPYPMAKLKVYADRMSQPCRAVLIFCRANHIDFEEVLVDLSKRQHRSAQYKEINPTGQVPAIVDGRFKLFESHAILSYLACSFPGIPDHWYPGDLFRRAKINSILDWHHSNLRRGSALLVLSSGLGPALGLPLNPETACKSEALLTKSLSTIESAWLDGKSKFLVGGSQPSIADLSLVCEIMQLQVLAAEDRDRILGPHKRIQQWMEDVKKSTSPHFEEFHGIIYKAKERLEMKRSKL